MAGSCLYTYIPSCIVYHLFSLSSLSHTPPTLISLSLPSPLFPTPVSLIPPSTGDADWSDYALWWPDNRIWLNKPRQSLYAYGIMSDAKLEFSPVHRHLTVELPDRHRYQVCVSVCLSVSSSVSLCLSVCLCLCLYICVYVCDALTVHNASLESP